VVVVVKKELSIKQIYDDFVDKIVLTDTEKEILERYIKNETITAISVNMAMGTASVSRTIAQLKVKYKLYKDLEMAKLMILLGEK